MFVSMCQWKKHNTLTKTELFFYFLSNYWIHKYYSFDVLRWFCCVFSSGFRFFLWRLCFALPGPVEIVTTNRRCEFLAKQRLPLPNDSRCPCRTTVSITETSLRGWRWGRACSVRALSGTSTTFTRRWGGTRTHCSMARWVRWDVAEENKFLGRWKEDRFRLPRVSCLVGEKNVCTCRKHVALMSIIGELKCGGKLSVFTTTTRMLNNIITTTTVIRKILQLR